MANPAKIKSFEDLIVWQESQHLAVKIYEATQSFPKEEQFGITNQLRRAASSISANIAEGFGRQTNKDKVHFYTMAYGSLLEVRSFLHLAEKLNYTEKGVFKNLLEQCTVCQKLIVASRKSLT